MLKKNRMFQSEEARAVSRASQELNVLTDALRLLQVEIDAATGVEKKQLKEKKAELKYQETVNRARQNIAVSKFQNRFNTNISADDIASGAENAKTAQENNKSFANNISKFGQGVDILMDAASKLASIEYDKEFETIAARTDLLMADIEALSQKSIMAADLSSKAYLDAINSSLSSLTDGINEGAYAAANNLIDLSAQSQIFGLEKERIELENKNTKNLRTAQRDATYSNLYAQQTQAEVTAGAELTRMGTHALNNVEILGESAGEAPGAVGDVVAGIAKGAAAATSTMIQSENKLIVQRYENEKKVTEAVLKSNQEVEKKWIESGANVEKAWLQFAQKIEGGLVKSEAAANDLGVSLGLSGEQLESFKRSMFESQVAVSKWGKTLEDIQKLQNAYTDNTGRNIQFSKNDLETSFALDKLAGQDGLSAQLTGAMELFNHSVSDSNEMFYEMYKNVSKIGLNGRKYLKDLSKSLKLAERFQFKNGVKGMMDMAKWAQNTRFNMDSLDGMLQNFSENGLEGAITKAAGMQVLGGNFAMGADPLAMLWERYNDPQAFAQRQQDMLKGLGSYDAKTGEVTFNMGEQIQLEQIAKYTGQSVQDLMNQQRQRIKGEKMANSLRKGVNWSDDEKSLITNKAQLVNGEWKVTMDNGEQKSVSQLNPEDLNHLKPEDNEEKLVNYVYDIRDMMTQLTGAKQEATAKLELDGYSQWYQEEQARIQNVVADFNTNYEKYLAEFKEKMGLATEAQKTMLDIMNQGNSNIDSASSEILEEGHNIASTLAQVNQLLQDSLNEINNRKDEYKPKQGEIGYEHSNATTRLAPYDPRFSLTWKNPLDENKVPVASPKVRKAQEAARHGDFTTAVQNAYIGRSSIMDGVLKAEGQSMAVAASKVTPINDGEIATTDPQDHAIFAKTGGPFDTLFNGIFSKINEISKVLPQSLPYIFPEQPIKELYKPLYSQQGQAGNVSNSPIKIEPITLNINLDGALGKSKDFLEEITNNPMLVRSLSQLISESINKNINGGKSACTGGLPTARFKSSEF